jgi:hypothetical protein
MDKFLSGNKRPAVVEEKIPQKSLPDCFEIVTMNSNSLAIRLSDPLNRTIFEEFIETYRPAVIAIQEVH